jgi:restriction endonuclease Mrr
VPIPDFQTLMLPVLEACADGTEQRAGDRVERIIVRRLAAMGFAPGNTVGPDIRQDVGARIEEALHIKRIDEDAFVD